MNQILTCLLGIGIAASTFAGNDNSGGGNTLPSTPASLQDIVSNLKTIQDQAYAGFLRLKLAATDPNYFAQNRDTSGFRPIIEKIMNTYSKDQILDKFYSFALVMQNGSCYDQGAERDAAADTATNRVCVSLTRLVDKKIPFHDLSLKLTALMIHEVGHLLLLSETDAAALQAAFESYGKMVTPAQMIEYKKKAAFHIGYDTPDLIDDILEKIQKNESDTKLCFKIGQLDGIGGADKDTIRNSYSIFGSLIFNEETLSGSEQVWDRIFSLESYCGVDGGSQHYPEVPKGDKRALKNAVLSLKSEMKALASELIKAPFALKKCDEYWSCD